MSSEALPCLVLGPSKGVVKAAQLSRVAACVQAACPQSLSAAMSVGVQQGKLLLITLC